jgi:hypothetical protein
VVRKKEEAFVASRWREESCRSRKCWSGGVHASGSLAPGNVLIDGSSNAFAIRALEADCFMARFKNGVNDRQNNLRLSAGIVVRF